MGHEGHDHRHGHDHDHDHEHGHDHGHAHCEPSPSGEHKSHAPTHVAAFVITSSDTRDESADKSGRAIRDALESHGHTVCGYRLVRDEPSELKAALEEAQAAGARAILINGGTGIGRRDVVVETVRPLLQKELPGFGELFRMLSWDEIGSAAMMSRALAGTWNGAIVFAMPGSTNAVKLAMQKLVLPELGHAVREMSK